MTTLPDPAAIAQRTKTCNELLDKTEDTTGFRPRTMILTLPHAGGIDSFGYSYFTDIDPEIKRAIDMLNASTGKKIVTEKMLAGNLALKRTKTALNEYFTDKNERDSEAVRPEKVIITRSKYSIATGYYFCIPFHLDAKGSPQGYGFIIAEKAEAQSVEDNFDQLKNIFAST